jgi:hypothetical protein
MTQNPLEPDTGRYTPDPNDRFTAKLKLSYP